MPFWQLLNSYTIAIGCLSIATVAVQVTSCKKQCFVGMAKRTKSLYEASHVFITSFGMTPQQNLCYNHISPLSIPRNTDDTEFEGRVNLYTMSLHVVF